MQTKTYNVYTFDELTDEQKEKAVRNLYDINVEHDWWEHILEDASVIGLRIYTFELDRNRYATGEFMVLGQGEHCAGLIMSEHGNAMSTYTLAKKYLADLETLRSKYPNYDTGSEIHHGDYEAMRDKITELETNNYD